MGRLSGDAGLITGGEGSLGMAMARMLAAEGARLMLVGVDAHILLGRARLAAGDRPYGAVSRRRRQHVRHREPRLCRRRHEHLTERDFARISRRRGSGSAPSSPRRR